VLIEHRGKAPEVDPSAYVAPTAVICGAVPIGWIAVGDPAQIFPPGQHERIWAVQEGLDFPGTVYGVSRDTPAKERMTRQAEWFAAHRDDRLL
jgi:gamma-carbonic anhydrase